MIRMSEGLQGKDADITHLNMPEVDSTLYARQFVGDLTAFYADLGAPDEFVAILGRHVQDTELVFARDVKASHLTVAREGDKWVRQAVISETELYRYSNALYAAFMSLKMSATLRRLGTGYAQVVRFYDSHSQEIPDTAKVVCKELALDWIFFELSADMFGNSYDMQQRFDHYIPDYNGQSPYAEAHKAPANVFLEMFGNEDLSEEEQKNAREAEYIAFRNGVAMELLADNLMRLGLAETESRARWVTNAIGQAYPKKHDQYGFSEIAPLTRPELMERINLLVPRRNIRRMNLELGELAAGVLLEDEDEDED